MLFFPATASAYAETSAGERDGKARRQWEGSGFSRGERDYAPGYAELATRGLDLFDRDSPAHAAFTEAVGFVAGVLDPHRTLLFAQGDDDASPSRVRHDSAGEA